MLKMSLARVSSYTYEVSGIWESILIPAGTCAFCSTCTHTVTFRAHMYGPIQIGRKRGQAIGRGETRRQLAGG